MITWRHWRLRRGRIEVFVFRPTWRTITIGVGFSYEPERTETTLMIAIGPLHAAAWWTHPPPKEIAT